MDWKILTTAFLTFFLAEIGDKTNLAALALSAHSRKPIPVFIGGLLGFALATFLAIALGGVLGDRIPKGLIQKAAAVLFIAVGLYLWFWGRHECPQA